MLDNKLETKEAIALMVNLICNKFFVVASNVICQASEGAVLFLIMVIFAEAYTIWRICAGKLKNKTLLDIIKFPKIKIVACTAIIIAILLSIVLNLHQISYGIKNSILPETPIQITIIIFAAAMLISVKCNISGIAKTAVITVPLIYIGTLFLALTTFEKVNFYKFFPIMGNGIFHTIGKSLPMLSILFEVLLLFFIPSMLKNPKDIIKVGNHSFFWSFILIAVVSGMYFITSTSFDNSDMLPFLSLVKRIQIDGLIQRFDSLFMLIYSISGFLYLSTMLYFFTHIISKVTNSNKQDYLFEPLTTLIVIVAMFNFFTQMLYTYISLINFILWIVSFAIPLLICIFFCKRSTQ